LHDSALTAKRGAIGGDILEPRWIQSVMVNGIAFGTACASREKRVERMVRDSDDAIGHKETDSPHRFAIEALLEAAGGKHCFVRIMHMNDPPTDRHPQSGQQIDCAHNVMVAVQDVVFSTPQLRAQSADKLHFLHDRNRRMDYACAECSRLLVHHSRLPQRAVEGPIDIYSPSACVPQHPHEPVLHRTSLELFDDVENFGTRLSMKLGERIRSQWERREAKVP